ncbi:MAG: ATP:cob(I)alamin adenosyltransferase [candidate division WS6 bacterium GW2011_GWA2_37_6]|uniref:Corrinoid adenosyltransferase n=1 Tax=candidate division WS6 bacterium GW2011_GWA2_37_6 TaxID=1619087 RepID=A0A0G0JFG6_9BACT|nr:MAG: ATP:cob(I)alamin adenosyltransferase [candidate division WS6 bacterium GW2011_GWA2_37_6]
MSIYTKKGDKGSTSLYGGRRVSKSIVRLEVIGCIDELNSLLGLINSKLKDEQKTWTDKSFTLTNRIERIQGELLQVGADIATPYSASTTFQKNIDRLAPENIKNLENEIDEMDTQLPKLRYFIIPGGSETASIAQLARAMTRRAERNAVRLTKGAKLNPNVLKYLNRLSDWLFITARYINKNSGEKDKIWN